MSYQGVGLQSTNPYQPSRFVKYGKSRLLGGVNTPYGLQYNQQGTISRAFYVYESFSVLNLNPLAWYDANDASTITLVGSKVSQWNDKSTNGYHATQTTDSQRGTYNLYQQNGLPTISFRGSGIGMTTALNINATPYSIMIVCRQATAGGRVVQSGSINALMAPARSTDAFYVSSVVRNAAVVSINTWCKVTMIIGSGTSKVWYNSVNYGAGTHGNWGTFRIAAVGAFNETPQAEIAEIIVFNKALTDQERTDLENYIYQKWSI